MFGRDVECDEETAAVVGVPSNLEEIPPGYVLAAVLDDIDIDVCSGYDRVRVLQAQENAVPLCSLVVSHHDQGS